MNRRKGGEDFYFLHKIIPLGNFHEINTTKVMPSPRPSTRVPFGTGTAICKYVSEPAKGFMTYAPESFILLKEFFDISTQFYKKSSSEIAELIDSLLEPIKSHLNSIDAVKAIEEINNNCRTTASFMNKFFRWFNSFRVVKYLNYTSRSHYKDINIKEASLRLLKLINREADAVKTDLELLMIMREADKNQLLN